MLDFWGGAGWIGMAVAGGDLATGRLGDLGQVGGSASRQVASLTSGRIPPAPRPGVRRAGHNLAFKPGISAESIFVKPKHFLPRSLSDAPTRKTRPRARRPAAGAGRIGMAAARGRSGRRTRTTRRRADGTTGTSAPVSEGARGRAKRRNDECRPRRSRAVAFSRSCRRGAATSGRSSPACRRMPARPRAGRRRRRLEALGEPPRIPWKLTLRPIRRRRICSSNEAGRFP